MDKKMRYVQVSDNVTNYNIIDEEIKKALILYDADKLGIIGLCRN